MHNSDKHELFKISVKALHRSIRQQILHGLGITAENQTYQAADLDESENAVPTYKPSYVSKAPHPILQPTAIENLTLIPTCVVVTLTGEISFDLLGNPYFVMQRPWYKRWFFWIKPSTISLFYATSSKYWYTSSSTIASSKRQQQQTTSFGSNGASLRAEDKESPLRKDSLDSNTHLESDLVSPSSNNQADKAIFSNLLTLRRIYLNYKRISLDNHWI